ncbi:MAG TPA: NYN domain-containing protein, partial [Candidatus Saccharimonadales bacterium]|nr:NYN domain-containing protein [Candidatus Saccharimonadales bacterium]
MTHEENGSQALPNYAFIDAQNLHAGVESLGWKMDHKKFREYLTAEHGVKKAYMFLGFMEEHQPLYSALQEAGFILYFKPLVRHDESAIKGNVDADMVLQTMIDIERYNQAVIVSGDGDFAGLIRHLASV